MRYDELENPIEINGFVLAVINKTLFLWSSNHLREIDIDDENGEDGGYTFREMLEENEIFLDLD